ncbi:MAG: hypothetical protein ACYCOR_14030 [Acidobacteriaceae bacterium]
MNTRRWQHFTAMALIGDGMMAIGVPAETRRRGTSGQSLGGV